MPYLEDACAGDESLIASPMPAESDSATENAESGGLSTATGLSEKGHSYVRGSAATANEKQMIAPLLIEGWLCDAANPFGHTVCREARQVVGEESTPAALVLTFGDGPGDASKRIDVPERVLEWLKRGEDS